MKAKPLDSWVSGFRMTLTSSATRFSARSQERMSSLVTQVGRLPRKTVKLILWCKTLQGIFGGPVRGRSPSEQLHRSTAS